MAPHTGHSGPEARTQTLPANEAHVLASSTRAPSRGAARLGSLVDALLNDPAVQQRITEDPELRRLWNDPAVRDHVMVAPETMTGMAKLLELVRELSVDPAVQRRIEEDPELRDLWRDPGVRQRVQR